ncbi:RNA polymerase sigma-70 factor [Pontibacter rugosus]|uniref:RNA polymerase sigma-70 factor n=1 Tax=Pontibacter rugosus TaxID=1745966 RepID=A0ABW3SKZ7_9BACT
MEPVDVNWLLNNICAGSRGALEKLYLLYYQCLCDFACQIVKSADLAEEVVSDVFLAVWQKRETLEIRTSLKTYLYAAVRNQALLYLKKERLWEELDEQAQSQAIEHYNPLDALLFRELNYSLDSIINRLPEQDRLILRLKLSGLTYAEVAKTLSLTEKTVEYRLSKSQSFLKRAYHQQQE